MDIRAQNKHPRGRKMSLETAEYGINIIKYRHTITPSADHMRIDLRVQLIEGMPFLDISNIEIVSTPSPLLFDRVSISIPKNFQDQDLKRYPSIKNFEIWNSIEKEIMKTLRGEVRKGNFFVD